MQSRNRVLTEYHYTHVKVDEVKKKYFNNFRFCKERMTDYIYIVVISTDCIVYTTTLWSQKPSLDIVNVWLYITILEYNVVYHPDSEPNHCGADYLMQLSYGVISI